MKVPATYLHGSIYLSLRLRILGWYPASPAPEQGRGYESTYDLSLNLLAAANARVVRPRDKRGCATRAHNNPGRSRRTCDHASPTARTRC